MNLHSETLSQGALNNAVVNSGPPTKPKRVRRPNQRRPKVLPATMRQRLVTLGHNPRAQDTTDSNLNDLIDRLSSDLQNYTLAAQNWQNKLLALKAGELSPEEFLEEHEMQATEGAETSTRISRKATSGAVLEADVLNRLKRAAAPTLDLVNMPLPRVHSAIQGALAVVQTEECFLAVLNNIDQLANLFGMFKGESTTWGNISKLKPDFSEARAREIWRDVFEPIDTPFDSFQWQSGPVSRALPLAEHIIDPSDSDFDHLDRRLAVSTDYDVIDMLHYCSLLLAGLSQSLFDNDSFSVARDHLGKQVERLLREAIFTRNIGSNSDYAHGLLAGILGVLRHFSSMARSGAVVSLLEIAWSTCMQHIEGIHPIMKGVVSFVSTILAPSQSRRAVWMARNQENFQSTPERYFHLTTTAYFTASYYALTTRDDDALLHYLAQLDELLAPKKPEELNTLSGPFYEDPTSCWHLGKHPRVFNDDDISTGSSTTKVFGPSETCWNYAVPKDYTQTKTQDDVAEAPFAHLPVYSKLATKSGNTTPTLSVSSPPSPHPSDPECTFLDSNQGICGIGLTMKSGYKLKSTQPTWDTPPMPTLSDSRLPSTTSLYQIPAYHSMMTISTDHESTHTGLHAVSDSLLSSSPSVPMPHHPISHNHNPLALSSCSLCNTQLHNLGLEEQLSISVAGASHNKLRPVNDDWLWNEDLIEDNSSNEALTVHGSPGSFYIPNEDFKTCLRTAVHLIRAEAALISSDYQTCRNWVDEAERELSAVPDMFLQHKIFLVDVSILKQVFNTKCPFPNGTRSVAEEMERRILSEAERRNAKFPKHKSERF